MSNNLVTRDPIQIDDDAEYQGEGVLNDPVSDADELGAYESSKGINAPGEGVDPDGVKGNEISQSKSVSLIAICATREGERTNERKLILSIRIDSVLFIGELSEVNTDNIVEGERSTRPKGNLNEADEQADAAVNQVLQSEGGTSSV